jgi:RNA recognition motif-containing protein
VTNIYVGNLSFRATEEDIRNAFSQFGQVTSVNIVMDQDTGRSRGFAFVEMADANEASAAIEGLNEQEIVGRRVIVNEARPREERPRGGGRFGGGGGGGGGRYGGGGGGGGGGRDYGGGGGGGGGRDYGGGGGGGGGRDYGGGGGGGGRRGNYSRDDR